MYLNFARSFHLRYKEVMLMSTSCSLSITGEVTA
jgi:hypothetical protein